MKSISIDLTPEEYHVPELMRRAVARQLGVDEASLEPLRVVRRTLDCRRRNVVYHCLVDSGQWAVDSGSQLNTEICLGELSLTRLTRLTSLTSLTSKAGKTVVIVGAGPAGLFAALRCLELGMKPIIVERGKPVEKRKYDIARLTKEHYVNPDSNWCFGEGGAGTYSDGKLYTRSTN